ncbi:MAG: VOC family protein [Gammaproteobacteria bacterium]
MKLAKQHLDIGLFTNDIGPQLEFWGQTVGLRLDHELTLNDGWLQHRFDAHDSVIKINEYKTPLSERPASGYSELSIAYDKPTVWEGQHPGGETVRLVPRGTDGIQGIGITVTTPDPDRLMEFYIEVMQFQKVDEHIACCGDSLLFAKHGPGGSKSDTFIERNFRYLTVQIFDADEACDEIVARGGTLGRAPVSFGDVARYGFVCDPDGNWIEISARTSLTGTAPPAD